MTTRPPEFTTREESWGRILYRARDDEFSAEVLPNKEVRLEAPLAVGWVIVGSCNLQCIHCYGNQEALPSGYMSWQNADFVLRQIIDAGVLRAVISGGEPLLYPYIFDAIDLLASSGVAVVLGTNGAYICDENVDRLLCCTRVELSLDGHTEELNNRIRPSRRADGNAFSQTAQAVALCSEVGVKLRVLTAVNVLNQHHLVDMADQLVRWGVKEWAVSWTLPAGRALPIFAQLKPIEENVIQSLGRAAERHPDLKIRYSNRTSGFNRYYCLILPDGSLATEDLMLGRKIVMGSLLQSRIQDYWNDSHYNTQDHFRKWVHNRVVQLRPKVASSRPRERSFSGSMAVAETAHGE